MKGVFYTPGNSITQFDSCTAAAPKERKSREAGEKERRWRLHPSRPRHKQVVTINFCIAGSLGCTCPSLEQQHKTQKIPSPAPPRNPPRGPRVGAVYEEMDLEWDPSDMPPTRREASVGIERSSAPNANRGAALSFVCVCGRSWASQRIAELADVFTALLRARAAYESASGAPGEDKKYHEDPWRPTGTCVECGADSDLAPGMHLPRARPVLTGQGPYPVFERCSNCLHQPLTSLPISEPPVVESLSSLGQTGLAHFLRNIE